MNLMIINDDDISIKGTSSINLRSMQWLDLFLGLRICEWEKKKPIQKNLFWTQIHFYNVERQIFL